MKRKELICIGCPMGCPIVVEMEDGKVLSVTGNTCPRGESYARKEVTNPTRIVTTTVRVDGGKVPMINVKTEQDIPKDKIFECTSWSDSESSGSYRRYYFGKCSRYRSQYRCCRKCGV